MDRHWHRSCKYSVRTSSQLVTYHKYIKPPSCTWNMLPSHGRIIIDDGSWDRYPSRTSRGVPSESNKKRWGCNLRTVYLISKRAPVAPFPARVMYLYRRATWEARLSPLRRAYASLPPLDEGTYTSFRTGMYVCLIETAEEIMVWYAFLFPRGKKKRGRRLRRRRRAGFQKMEDDKRREVCSRGVSSGNISRQT